MEKNTKKIETDYALNDEGGVYGRKKGKWLYF